MSMLDCNWPLFEMRAYESKFEEGNYIVLQTQKTRWVLDYKLKTDEDYATRRLKLKTDPLRPYKIYPLYKMYSTIGQVVNSKKRNFIDSSGKLIKYKPSKFFKIYIEKIKASWITLTGYKAYKVLGTSHTFVFPDGDYTHLAYIKMGKRAILFDMLILPDSVEDAQKHFRIKI